MKDTTVIYEKGDHKWVILHHNPNLNKTIVKANEYLIQNGNKYIVTDPGGIEAFPEVIATLADLVDINQFERVFCSHQDPDVFSSLGLWLKMNPDLKIILPSIWLTFMLTLGGDRDNFILMPDEGINIDLGGLVLSAIPAHHVHSSGNFSLYDPTANILFSGDIGSALLPEDQRNIFVTNFEDHIQYIELFHKRWFSSNDHKNQWCERVLELKPDMLCPQHGMIYQGEDVNRFLDWFYHLKVGVLDY